jgi:hypothetical protein
LNAGSDSVSVHDRRSITSFSAVQRQDFWVKQFAAFGAAEATSLAAANPAPRGAQREQQSESDPQTHRSSDLGALRVLAVQSPGLLTVSRFVSVSV